MVRQCVRAPPAEAKELWEMDKMTFPTSILSHGGRGAVHSFPTSTRQPALRPSARGTRSWCQIPGSGCPVGHIQVGTGKPFTARLTDGNLPPEPLGGEAPRAGEEPTGPAHAGGAGSPLLVGRDPTTARREQRSSRKTETPSLEDRDAILAEG